MKRILSITIALCFVFASVLPVYAEAWDPNQARAVTDDVSDIQQDINNLTDYFYDFWATANGQNAPTFYSWQDFMYEFWRLSEFLIPRGSYLGQTNLWQIIEGTLPNILTYVSSWMSTNTSYLNDLKIALTNYYRDNSGTINVATRKLFTHSDLVNSAITYPIREFTNSPRFGYTDVRYSWLNGTPLGNIALILDKFNNNYVLASQMNYDSWFEDADTHTVLGIWDSQGETLTQETWSPGSALNGLYKYLAYTQRDVARLTYVIASDEEIETREKARSTQTAVMDDFVDPDGAGAASVDDFGSISNASSGVQDNFNTGVSASGVWNVFERNYEWFSQETANNLAYQPQRSTRNLKSVPDQEYETPYLDSYYEELHDIIGF